MQREASQENIGHLAFIRDVHAKGRKRNRKPSSLSLPRPTQGHLLPPSIRHSVCSLNSLTNDSGGGDAAPAADPTPPPPSTAPSTGSRRDDGRQAEGEEGKSCQGRSERGEETGRSGEGTCELSLPVVTGSLISMATLVRRNCYCARTHARTCIYSHIAVKEDLFLFTPIFLI